MQDLEEIVRQIMELHDQSTISGLTSPESQTTKIPEYRCPLCQDTGWIQCEIAEGYTGVRPCECVKAREAEKRILRSGLADEIKSKTFRNFKTETDWQKSMKEKAIAYGKAYFEAKEKGGKLPWFFLAGNAGSGKTHLCTALCGALLNRNIAVSYMQWVTESRRLRAMVNEPDFDVIVEPFTDVEVLYIDDLFKQNYMQERLEVSKAEGKVLFEILNTRYIQNKATIISTEWYLETELMPIDDGTFSRVYERSKGFAVSVERGADKNYRINGGMND